MALKQTNPTRPRTDRDRNEFRARAPYNFVSLPEKMVQAQEPLSHDRYFQEIDGKKVLTGWIDCTLETCSPTYIRGMMTKEQHNRFGHKKSDELSPEEKKEMAPFFTTGEKTAGELRRPAIPASTLRGMIRTLIEIAGHGRMHWVAKEPTFTFRAVAAAKDDPLRQPYQDALGAFGRNVRAGYLEKDGKGTWLVRPAMAPESMRWPERSAYLKVKEKFIGGKDIPDFIRFDSEDYRPQLHKVSFGVEIRKSQRGPYVAIGQIGSRDAGYAHKGVLVCSGNMAETGKKGQKSPRKNHALVLEPNQQAAPLPVRTQAIKDYRNGLTPFQKDELRYDWAGGAWGCLKIGEPVFYVEENGEVAGFGHCPNFRIPAQLHHEKRAATPEDFIPKNLQAEPNPDLSEALFGWVEEPGHFPKDQRAGRVCFEDAACLSVEDDLWLQAQPITLHTLAGPKPTTFQHYLVQDKNKGHGPDNKAALAHYGTPPGQTEIRGHKLYWHQGAMPAIEAGTKEREHPDQLAQVIPLCPGVRFSFRIRFENLREAELGALLWALALPGEPGKAYRHKLGMGKPLGMGAVKIMPRLFCTDRRSRYSSLFQDQNWHEASEQQALQHYLNAFEKFVLERVDSSKPKLVQLYRIRELFAMLEWRDEVDDGWKDKTRYMEIERGLDKVNEYKERPVLPDPLAVQGSDIKTETAQQQKPAKGQQHGVVKVFGLGAYKDFGFIQPDSGGADVFVHKSQLRGVASLDQGQRVIFSVTQGPKGLRANDVSLEG